jgi:hypothetical protein
VAFGVMTGMGILPFPEALLKGAIMESMPTLPDQEIRASDAGSSRVKIGTSNDFLL